MKRAQQLGVAIAGVCGLDAFFGVMGLINKPTRVVKEGVTTNTTQVLVASAEIGLGQIIGSESFRWLDWPQDAVNPSYIQRANRPRAMEELRDTVARAPMLAREPVTAMKLVRAGEGGVLAAIPPSGMRAISTRIKERLASVGSFCPTTMSTSSSPVAYAAGPVARSIVQRRSSTTFACSPARGV